MQLMEHGTHDHNAVKRYDASSFTINETRYEANLLVMPEGPVQQWPVTEVAALDREVARSMLELDPEVVVLGTGEALVFPAAEFLREFASRGIGCEVMDTGAACRTYNVLASEGRKVLGALMLIDPAPGSPGSGLNP